MHTRPLFARTKAGPSRAGAGLRHSLFALCLGLGGMSAASSQPSAPPVPLAPPSHASHWEQEPWNEALQPRPVGQATQSLLQMQRSGQWASPHPRPLPAAVAERIYQRYLDSFKHPLPEHFAPSLESNASP